MKAAALHKPDVPVFQHPNGPASTRLSTSDVAAVVLLIVIAAALRFWRLGEWGFYYDEYYTFDNTLNIRWHSVYGIPVVDWLHREIRHVPLTPVLMRLVFAVWGASEWSARFLQAAAGVAAVPIFYVLFVKMSCRWLGWLGALLIAVSPWHVFHSQESRYYSIVFLFGGIAACAFYLGLEQNSKGWMFSSALLLFLALLTHTSAVFVGAALVVYPLALWVFRYEKPPGLRWRTVRWFIFPSIVGGLLMTPVFIYVLFGWGLGLEEPSYTAPHIVFALGYNFGLPLLAIAAFGGLESLRRRERLGLFAAVYAGVPLLLLLSATFVLISGIGPRYLVCTLPAYFLLAAYGGVQILRHIGEKSRWLSAGLIALMLTVQLPLLMSYYYDGDRADYKRAAAFLKEHAGASDVVLAPQSPYTLAYYLGRHVQLLTVSEEELRKFQHNSDVTRWVVVVVGRRAFVKDEKGRLEQWLHKHGQLVYEYRSGQFDHHRHDLRVYKF